MKVWSKFCIGLLPTIIMWAIAAKYGIITTLVVLLGLFRIFLATLALTDQDLLADVIEKYDITSDDIKSL